MLPTPNQASNGANHERIQVTPDVQDRLNSTHQPRSFVNASTSISKNPNQNLAAFDSGSELSELEDESEDQPQLEITLSEDQTEEDTEMKEPEPSLQPQVLIHSISTTRSSRAEASTSSPVIPLHLGRTSRSQSQLGLGEGLLKGVPPPRHSRKKRKLDDRDRESMEIEAVEERNQSIAVLGNGKAGVEGQDESEATRSQDVQELTQAVPTGLSAGDGNGNSSRAESHAEEMGGIQVTRSDSLPQASTDEARVQQSRSSSEDVQAFKVEQGIQGSSNEMELWD